MRSVQDWIDAYLPLITDAEASACTDAEISAFEQKWQVAFREDHKRFLRLFGGGTGRSMPEFLKITNASYNISIMDYHYEDYLDFPDEEHIPSGWLMFGIHDVDNFVAVNQRTGELCTYYGDVLYDFYADSIDKFLAQQLYSYIHFKESQSKRKVSGFFDQRTPHTDDQIKMYLKQHGFEVFEALCDVKKIAAQRGDIYFFSDFESPNFSSVLARNLGLMAFSSPEIEANETEILVKALAAMLGLKRRIRT